MAPELSSKARANLARAMADSRTYIETFLWIKDRKSRLRPFIYNPVQVRLDERRRRILDAGNRVRMIILKARRGGVTTWVQGESFYDVATLKHQSCATIGHHEKSTEIIFRIAQRYYDNLHPNFRPKRLAQTGKKDLNFPTLDSLYYIGTAGSVGFGRGDTLRRAHWSEVAWSRGNEEDHLNLLAGMANAASHGEVILESTAHGVGGLFHSMWLEASAGKSEWDAIFIPWYEDPMNTRDLTREERDELEDTLTNRERDLRERKGLTLEQFAWYRHEAKQPQHRGGLMLQEHPDDPSMAFLVSGQTWMDMQIVAALIKELPEEPLEETDSGALRVFVQPMVGHEYIAASDVGEGLPDSDYSVTVILDKTTMEQCAVLRGRWGPREFALRTVRLCDRYNHALWATERNNHGHSVLNTAENEIGYGNLYYHQEYNVHGKSELVLGFPTSTKTRPIMLDLVKLCTEDGLMRVNSRVFLEESQTFVRHKDGKYRARDEKGCYDDEFIAWSIALAVRDSSPAGPSVAPSQLDPDAGIGTRFPRSPGSMFPR